MMNAKLYTRIGKGELCSPIKYNQECRGATFNNGILDFTTL